MIEDRYYMRRPAGHIYRSATFTLIVLNVIVFLLELAFFGPSLRTPFSVRFLELSPNGLLHGYLWQLATFQFMHANFLHLLFNCLAIYVFGNPVEEALQRKSFYTLYFASGMLGGLLQSLLGIFWRNSMFDASVVGASAGAYGLTAAFSVLYPDIRLFPIPIQAKYLLPVGIGSALLMMFIPSQSGNVAHAAHLGGMLAGYAFVRYAVHWNFRWPQLGRPRRRPVRRLVKVPSHKAATWRESEVIEEDLPAEEFLSKEVDPILDKISAQGIQSLTERERKILERARAKMGKR